MAIQKRRYWVTTDTHFGHDKMIEYCGRPKGFEDLIFRDWFRNIDFDDVLIHLGDICIGNDKKHHERYIRTVPCKKWLVKGNHDRKGGSWYLDNGWDFVGYFFLKRFYGKRILFSHRPMDLKNFPEEVDLNLHGHFHNSDFRKNEPDLAERLTDKHLYLAQELEDYKLLNLEHILKRAKLI